MSAVPLSQKLIVLLMLNRCKHPLTSEQIDVYMTENNWSDYMLVQQLKYELEESNFVTVTENAPHFYMLAPRGRDALMLFIDRLAPFLRRQVEVFVEKNTARMLLESTVFTDVQPQDGGISYRTQTRVYEGVNLVMELNLISPDRESALDLKRCLAENGSALHDTIRAFCAKKTEERSE